MPLQWKQHTIVIEVECPIYVEVPLTRGRSAAGGSAAIASELSSEGEEQSVSLTTSKPGKLTLRV